MTPWREMVDPGGLGAFGLVRTQPAALRHAGQDRIQRPRTQAIAVVVELFEHPLAVYATAIRGVMEDVNFPEAEQKLPDERIPHTTAIVARVTRSRLSIMEARPGVDV